MKKRVVITSLMIVALGMVLAFSVRETRIEEFVIDEWNPISPPTLYPHWDYDTEKFNSTGYAFMSRVKGDPQKRTLLESGEILELYLDIDVAASGIIRVRIGSVLPHNDSMIDYPFDSLRLPPKYNLASIFDESGVRFSKRVRIDGTSADFLDIANEGTMPVNISGAIKLVGKLPKTFHPFLGLGTLICLIGFFMLFYGVLTKPKRQVIRRKNKR